MLPPQWFESLRVELAQRHLPAAYRQRLLAELADHGEDLRLAAGGCQAPGDSAFDSLGSPQSVAQAALLQYRQGRFVARHPAAMFVFLPIPLALLAATVFMIVMSLARAYLPLGTWVPSLMPWVRLALVTVPFFLASLLSCRAARQAAVSFRWQIVACCLLAASAACCFSSLEMPTATEPGILRIAIAAPVTAPQMVQSLVPLAVLAWSYHRFHRRPMKYLPAA